MIEYIIYIMIILQILLLIIIPLVLKPKVIEKVVIETVEKIVKVHPLKQGEVYVGDIWIIAQDYSIRKVNVNYLEFERGLVIGYKEKEDEWLGSKRYTVSYSLVRKAFYTKQEAEDYFAEYLLNKNK